MKNKIYLAAGMMFFSSLSGACTLTLPDATLLPFNTQFALSQTVYDAIQADSSIATAIENARDEWDKTDAADRIGGSSGVINSSDCPAGQPRQIGAMAHFVRVPGACPTLALRGVPQTAAAFVDHGGTGSITLNLSYAWSTNAGAGVLDIQNYFTHEFGHVLGLDHQYGTTCGNDPNPPTCATVPGHNTMNRLIVAQETCAQTLNINDINSANDFYP